MRFYRVLGFGLLVMPVWALSPQEEPIVQVVEKVRPAVVNIYTERIVEQLVADPFDVYMNQFFGGGMARGNRIRWRQYFDFLLLFYSPHSFSRV